MKLINIKLEYEIVVLHGRVKNFSVGFSSNEEIPVLPCSKQAVLIVRYHHYRIHRDIDTVVHVVRNEFWPIKSRKLAAKQQAKCLVCKMIQAWTESQIMGDLPTFRSEMSPAFLCVAMDLFGPWEVKYNSIQRGLKRFRKNWGVVYTCMSTRAVYIDVAMDYSTLSVLHTV